MTEKNHDGHVQKIESLEEKIVKGDALRSEPDQDQVTDLLQSDPPQNEGYRSMCRE
jgi:hypothetical protein